MAMFVGDIMSKINIKVSIKNKESDYSYETKGIILNNELKYYEENNTKVIFNYDNNHLIRINDELRMDFTFDEDKVTKGTIEIVDIDEKNITVRWTGTGNIYWSEPFSKDVPFDVEISTEYILK